MASLIAVRAQAGPSYSWLLLGLLALSAAVLLLTVRMRVQWFGVPSVREPEFDLMLRDGIALFFLAVFMGLISLAKLVIVMNRWLVA